ncbi:hypothetical protein BGX23_012363 [Mortierella sp. AD031]|nr:hypothetical protein BGX23_012363 [Mortierella sp. AD031]
MTLYYNACKLPWIDTVVNDYATNSSIYSDTDLFNCCTSPGVCPSGYTGSCPYGFLDCSIGNSKYVCRFNDHADPTAQTCYQEGTLAITRCDFASICFGYQNYGGQVGLKYGVYSGYIKGAPPGTGQCVEEISLGSEKSGNCYGVGSTGCNIEGGVAPPPPVASTTTSTSAVLPTVSTANPATTSSGPGTVIPTNKGSDGVSVVARGGIGGGIGGRTVKRAALLLFVPMVLQFMFI